MHDNGTGTPYINVLVSMQRMPMPCVRIMHELTSFSLGMQRFPPNSAAESNASGRLNAGSAAHRAAKLRIRLAGDRNAEVAGCKVGATDQNCH